MSSSTKTIYLYENFFSVLMRQILPLLHKSFLNDVQIVCRDGTVKRMTAYTVNPHK